MIITSEDLRKAADTIVLEENIKKFFEEVFEPGDIENIIETSFEARRYIVETVIQDINGVLPENIVYVENPYNFEELSILSDNEQYRENLERRLKIAARQVSGATIVDFTKEIEHLEQRQILVPKKLTEDLRVIMLNLTSFERYRANNADKGPLWTLVHEVFHNYPEKDLDETSVQKKTFNWLLSYGYTTTILMEIAVQFVNNIIGWESNYNILNYMLNELKNKENELYRTYLIAMEEIFNREDITETVSASVRDGALKEIDKLINEL